MDKITVLIGNSEDKITEIVASYNKDNVAFTECKYYPPFKGSKKKKLNIYYSRYCNESTELVIIKGFKYASDIEELYRYTEEIPIEKQGKEEFYIHAKIIVVCTEDVSIDDFPLESISFKIRVSIINCNDGKDNIDNR